MNIFELQPLRKTLLGALTGVARASEGNEMLLDENTADIVSAGLIASIGEKETPVNDLTELVYRVKKEKFRLSPDCSMCKTACGRTDDFDIDTLKDDDGDIVTLKTEILSAAYGVALKKGADEEMLPVYLKALFILGSRAWNNDSLRETLDEIKSM